MKSGIKGGLHLRNGLSRSRMKYASVLMILFFMSSLSQMCFQASAQIPAPDPICVSKDTLLWELPNVSCGSIEAYMIFVSNNKDGPYSQLVTIVDPTQRKYWHENSSGETRYYYMKTKADCPVMTMELSDTINNIPPPKVPISVVTVENGNVRINWQQPSDDKVEGYVIYKSTTSGTIPIDTVTNVSTYVDQSAAVNNRSEYYYVLSIDQCGNPSLFDVAHRTIFVEAEVDSCERTITLNWNPYEGWGTGVDHYEVYRIEQSSETMIASVDADSLGYEVQGILDNQEYCYEIRAYKEGGSLISTSQELCINPDVTQPVQYSNIYRADVKLNGDIEVNWEWNSDAQLADGSISTSGSGDFTIPNVMNLSDRESFLDTENDAGSSAIDYQINTTDICDSTFSSDQVSSIYLTAQSLPSFNVGLEWTEFDVLKASNVSYTLERLVDNSVVETIQLNSPSGMHEYPFDPTNTVIYKSCYRIIVNYDYTYEDGSTEKLTMHSNVACPTFEIQMQAPNAMVYQGVNDVFKPVFLVPELIDSYSLEIYSRNGEKIFSTTDINEGWNGAINGQVMPQGVYVYKITATRRGNEKSFQGHFTLLH